MHLGKSSSPWSRSVKALRLSDSPPDLVDVAVVGAGIFGATTALLLAKAGLRVAIIDSANPLEHSTTAGSTAKATIAQGTRLATIASRLGDKAALAHIKMTFEAMQLISETTVDSELDLVTADQWLYTNDASTAAKLTQVDRLLGEAGVTDTHSTSEGPLGWSAQYALRVPAQYSLDPGHYLEIVLRAAIASGATLTVGATATSISDGNPCTIETTVGDVRAAHVVIATHSPATARGAYFARLKTQRHYGVAVITKGELPDYMTYDCGPESRSTRTFTRDGQQYLAVVGETFETGAEQPSDETGRWDRLVSWADERFGVQRVKWHWAAQDVGSPDGGPYIGRADPLTKHLYVGTAFNAWGITDGTAAAQILAAELTGATPSETADHWHPTRIGGLGAAVEVAKWQGQVSTRMVTGKLRGAIGPSADDLQPGEAGVFWEGLHQVAASRDEEGALCKLSAACTHLGCTVSWNRAERSWDCPCHGSRFAADGKVLDGPATKPLAQLDS